MIDQINSVVVCLPRSPSLSLSLSLSISLIAPFLQDIFHSDVSQQPQMEVWKLKERSTRREGEVTKIEWETHINEN